MLIKARFRSICLKCGRNVEIGDVCSYFPGRSKVEHEACSDEGQVKRAKILESKATDAAVSIPCPSGLSYLPYQRAGIAYAMQRTGTLIADEMGLGKTIQGIGVINGDITVKTVLIVCPASLKLNWKAELEKWLTRRLTVCVLSSKKVEPAQIVVVNYDMLKKIPATAHFDLMLLDEGHYVKNPKAARTKHVFAIRRRCKRCVILTGTPIFNKPVDLWPMLQLVAPEEWDRDGKGFFKFAKRYCNARQEYVAKDKLVWLFDGATNLDELNERMRMTCMVRRLKIDVLPELPPKRRQIIKFEAKALIADEEDNFPLTDEFVEEMVVRKIPFSELSAARHATALAKVDLVVEHVKEALEGGSEKIVLFAHHRDVIDQLCAALAEYGVVSITGGTPLKARDEAVRAFQFDSSVRLFIGTIAAAGVGLTLTASSHVVFAERSWNPSECSQAEDRVHRIGQLQSVLVQILEIEGSIDARVSEVIAAKQEIADLALDVDYALDVTTRTVGVEKAMPVPVAEHDLVLAQLRYLSARCDGASSLDGQGFNGFDSAFGKQLARLTMLSLRQFLAAKNLLRKYGRQLEASRVIEELNLSNDDLLERLEG